MSQRKRLAPLIGVCLPVEDTCHYCRSSDVVRIAAGGAGNLTNLQRASCGKNRGHLSRVALSSIADLVADHGRPNTPISIRRDDERGHLEGAPTPAAWRS